MKNDLKTHLNYYVSLAAMLILGLSVVLANDTNPELQVIVSMMISTLYVIWGIIHHVLHHDMSAKIVVEYVLIGTLGIILTLLVLL